jgi:hypothetical protein
LIEFSSITISCFLLSLYLISFPVIKCRFNNWNLFLRWTSVLPGKYFWKIAHWCPCCSISFSINYLLRMSRTILWELVIKCFSIFLCIACWSCFNDAFNLQSIHIPFVGNKILRIWSSSFVNLLFAFLSWCIQDSWWHWLKHFFLKISRFNNDLIFLSHWIRMKLVKFFRMWEKPW